MSAGISGKSPLERNNMYKYATLVLWIYIVLLVVGGMIGYLKARSKVSLIVSACSAAVLILCQIHIISMTVADILLAVLLVVFAIRLTKSKKFMPSGLLLVLTLAALVLRHIQLP
jgi:uncharacterized membrane protein (UPF0136 family)